MTRRRMALVAAALAAYAVSLLWLSFAAPGFTSPDENAAFVFADAFRTTGRMAVAEPLNAALGEAGGVVHPRSAVAVGAWLVPGSFLGMPFLAGLLGTVLGSAGMRYVTPALAVLAVLAWYAVVRRLSGDARVAAVAAVLFAAHPALWFYAARSMMHNVAFVAFLVFAAWFAAVRPWKHAADLAAAGACVGMAIFLRTSEAVWIAAALAALAVALRPRLAHAAAFGLGLAVPLALMLFLHADLYGSPFVNGYIASTPSASVAPTAATSQVNDRTGLLLPFGFHERAILKNVWHFGVRLFPWMTALAAIGAALAWREPQRGWRLLVVALAVLAAWLGVVYGSWSFNDNPDPLAVTIADSHVRYWLPAFLLSTPLAALAALRITAGKRALLVPLMLALVGFSAAGVFLGGDGLLAARRELFASAEKRDTVLASTEPEAVIIADRADKFLWPHRSVVVPLRSATTYAALPALAAAAPLYYFGIPFPQTDLDYLNNEKLAPLSLRIELVLLVDDEALYRIAASP